ncbi:FtsK/SpoIIIE domain-containing protein [Micromonospora musae]|uniref:FtsK/SpoIIIE domain-containing protein n=1 Tax=Micromonospora musae TaxID=1894970 RepID=UPI0038994C4C
MRSDQALDVLTVRMVRGQTPEEFHRVTANLAYAFGRRHARVYTERPDQPPTRSGYWALLLSAVDRLRYRDRPSVVYLVIVRTDALRTVVEPFDVPTVPNFTSLPLARREDLRHWRLHLLATHVLIGGATRSGKGSVLWSLVRALVGGITSGLVRLWVIDPKGSMEFAMGRRSSPGSPASHSRPWRTCSTRPWT